MAQRENLQIVREHWDLSGGAAHAVTKADIDDVVSKWTGIPISALKEEESEKLLRMEEELHKRIVVAGERDQRGGARHPAHAGGAQEPAPSGRLVPVPGPDRRRQDRGRAQPGRVPVRLRARR